MEEETKEGEARVVLKKIEKKKEMEERGEKQLIFPCNNWTKFYKNATDYSTGKGASTGESFATCWLPSMVANENITFVKLLCQASWKEFYVPSLSSCS